MVSKQFTTPLEDSLCTCYIAFNCPRITDKFQKHFDDQW
jgi:hypothetical protein